MAFSMLLRSPVCTNKALLQQVIKLGTQQSLAQRAICSTLPVKVLAVGDNKTTPILNAVRSFSTTSVRLSEKPHDHAKIWIIEKLVSAAMIPIIPIALLAPNRITDSILAILISAHAFWGLEAIAVDYVRASIFGPIIPKLALGLVYLFCIATLGGLFYIITHGNGLSNTILQFWSIKSDSQKA
ncbi:unnamed protein product [Arctia plantaginis]|uniref:Succinate dehydrogenase [ubiquinone] cytochrome b small subunit n=1 Tax=Arctia plantaginis TaxID=874455 RepID=A0A8S1AJL2_ARCPL|nr:unnamed protein product [Arctia plantaginis]